MTTTRLVEWFEKEAAGYLATIEQEAGRIGSGEADASPEPLVAAQSAARALAGSARLANARWLQRAASTFERALRRTAVQPGSAPRLAEDMRLTVDDLRYLLDASEPDDARDARVEVVAARWEEAGGYTAEQPAPDGGTAGFTAFVIAEVTAIGDTMEQGITAFNENPASREWLGAILRSQRALLGSVRLDAIPVIAEALRAVEDLCQLIVSLDVPVKSEWLDVFRSAREVLRSAVAAIEEGGEPGQTPALSRLRTLREELLARYGERVAAQAAEAPVEPETTKPAPEHPVDPRQRAVVLRAEIAQALGDQTEPRLALDELYGLLLNALR